MLGRYSKRWLKPLSSSTAVESVTVSLGLKRLFTMRPARKQRLLSLNPAEFITAVLKHTPVFLLPQNT